MTPLTRHLRGLAATLLFAALAGCATPPPAPPPKSLLEQDVNQATESLIESWRARRAMPLLLARLSPQPLVLGAFVDQPAGIAEPETGTAEAGFALPQSQASAKARQFVERRLASYAPELKLVSAEPALRSDAVLLLTARLAPQASHEDPRRMLTLVLVDLKTREVLARWRGPVRSVAADAFPTSYETDSPVLLNESAAAAQASARLFRSAPGTQLAGETAAAAEAAALLVQAQEAYAAGDFRRALALFERAAAMPSVHAIRAYNGQYLSHLKLGNEAQAREAFRRVVAEGLAARALAVKLLFMPGLTEFLSDAAVRAAYAGWLQEIAGQAAAAAMSTACLDIVGHTSRTGEEAYNQQLSLARSQRVQELLLASVPALAARLSVSGKGWSENIVGSGTDDARDAIDRRVEFRVVGCPAG